jgi:hypothetical protein
MSLDLEPDAELGFRRPDGHHLGTAVTGDHGFSPAGSAVFTRVRESRRASPLTIATGGERLQERSGGDYVMTVANTSLMHLSHGEASSLKRTGGATTG